MSSLDPAQEAGTWMPEPHLLRVETSKIKEYLLNLDHTDFIVRRELTQKMRFLLEDTTPVADPDESELQQCLAKHPERYGHAGTIDFQQVFLSRKSAADADRVAKTATSLKAQPDSYNNLGDNLPGGADWRAQGEADLRRNFGNEFAASIASAPLKAWTGPLRSTLGLHWVRVTARAPFKPAALDEVRQKVMVDCRLAKREAANRKALDGLREHYEIHMPGAAS